jgi:hypothetical protein
MQMKAVAAARRSFREPPTSPFCHVHDRPEPTNDCPPAGNMIGNSASGAALPPDKNDERTGKMRNRVAVFICLMLLAFAVASCVPAGAKHRATQEVQRVCGSYYYICKECKVTRTTKLSTKDWWCIEVECTVGHKGQSESQLKSRFYSMWVEVQGGNWTQLEVNVSRCQDW